jgi:hypothetical protein
MVLDFSCNKAARGDFDYLVLDENGYLYHSGSQRWLSAMGGADKAGTQIVLTSSPKIGFDQFAEVEIQGLPYIRHLGSDRLIGMAFRQCLKNNPIVLLDPTPPPGTERFASLQFAQCEF